MPRAVEPYLLRVPRRFGNALQETIIRSRILTSIRQQEDWTRSISFLDVSGVDWRDQIPIIPPQIVERCGE